MLDDLLANLSSRLPEIEWKLNQQEIQITAMLLPKNLFRHQDNISLTNLIDEIKADITTIKKQDHAGALYLSQIIERKINVLVRLCKQKPNKNTATTDNSPKLSVQALCTRQKWLNNMQKDIDKLQAQHQALAETLMKLTAKNANTQILLNLQKELGQAERKLTLAQENLKNKQFS